MSTKPGLAAMSITEFGRRIGVARSTAYELVAAGAVKVTDVAVPGCRPHLRVTEKELERFLASRELRGVAA